MAAEKKAGRPLGPTGDAVRFNIRRVRDAQGISGVELSARLASLDRQIPPLGIQRIEAGTRRVDVDDLAAIAVALGVSPATLLMPHDNVEGSDVQGENDLVPGVTGWPEPVSALTAWYWLGAERPLDDDTNVVTFLTRALPPWLVPLRLEIIHFPGES